MRSLSAVILLAVPAACFAATTTGYGGGSTTTNGSSDKAFQDGSTFGQQSQTTSQGATSQSSAQATMSYTATPPQTSTYKPTPPRQDGTDKQNYCASTDLKTLSEPDRRECEAINYMTGIDKSYAQGKDNPYKLDEKTDPMFTRYAEGMALSQRINASTCNITGDQTGNSKSGKTDVCTEYKDVKPTNCSVTNNPTCNYAASNPTGISSYATPGTTVVGNCCNAAPTWSNDYTGHIKFNVNFTLYYTSYNPDYAYLKFNLDTIDKGSYVKISIPYADDTGAVAVNGHLVWAGYGGTQIDGSKYNNLTGFLAGKDANGYTWVSKGTTYKARARLVSGNCLGYPYKVANTSAQGWGGNRGFFCNDEGNLVADGVETSSYYAAPQSVITNYLVVGQNIIEFLHVHNVAPKNDGSMQFAGEVYNIGVFCSITTDNGCAGVQ